MSDKHFRELEKIREKKRELQEKEDKVRNELLQNLTHYLVESQALDIDVTVLMGGVLEVIDRVRKGDSKTEEWKLAGQKFCQDHRIKFHKDAQAAKTVEKNKSDDQ